jgi:Right handed beta helix region
MPRFTFLIVALIAVTACGQTSDKYCGMHPEDTTNCMPAPVIDAPPTTIDAKPPQCTATAACTSTTKPVCDLSGGNGVCVVCTTTAHALCQDTTPVCGTDHTCQPCQNAADCPNSSVCLANGACAAEADVAYVDGAGTNNTICTKPMPCTKIASGLATQTALATARPYLKIKGAITEAVTIVRDVTVFADPGASLTRGTPGAVVTISGTSVVEIDDLTITASLGSGDAGILTLDTTALTLKRATLSKNKGNGISCGGSSLTVSGSTFSENAFAGIACTKGSVNVSSSTFTKNVAGGLFATGGTFDITNNFLYDNGDKDSSDEGGVLLIPQGGTTNRFEFNTVVDNHARDFVTALSAGVACDVTGFTAPNNIIARNDIHGDVNKPNANTSGKCTYPTSTIDKLVTALMFVSPDADHDYHLKAGSSAIDQATTTSSVTVDAQGDMRPQGPAKDQGADEFKPGG